MDGSSPVKIVHLFYIIFTLEYLPDYQIVIYLLCIAYQLRIFCITNWLLKL